MSPDAVDKGALHPRIGELLEVLDETRAALKLALARIPAAKRDTRRADGGWSVGEILDHLHKTEAAFCRLLGKRVADAPARGVPAETDRSSLLSRLDAARLTDRTRRLDAPGIVVPAEGARADAALAALESSRAELRRTLVAASGLALGTITYPHPALGVLDMYQWALSIAYHEARHAQQIREMADAGGA